VVILSEIVWVKDQGEFDLDYLLNLTSEKFVDLIRRDVESPNIKAIKVTKVGSGTCDVIAVSGSFMRVYTWYRYNDSFQSTALIMEDVSWALKVMQNDSHE